MRVDLSTIFLLVSKNEFLNSSDCSITRYAICLDPSCLTEADSFSGITIDQEIAIFPGDIPRAPVEFYFGALSPHKLEWSVVRSKFEICGYEKIQVVNITKVMILASSLEANQTSFIYDLSSAFNNTSPGNYCAIINFTVTAPKIGSLPDETSAYL